MSGSRVRPDTQSGDCLEHDDRGTQERRPLARNDDEGPPAEREALDDVLEGPHSAGESAPLVPADRGELAAGARGAQRDDPDHADQLAQEAGGTDASPEKEEGEACGGAVVTAPPRGLGPPNPGAGAEADGGEEAPSAPAGERINRGRRGAARPGHRRKIRKTSSAVAAAAAATANSTKRKPSSQSIGSASKIPAEAADGCCISCVLACLFCEFLTMCNVLLSCGECEECCCCAQACGADACCAGEDGQACCCCDCELAAACCENDECLEVCCGFCAG